MTMLLGGLALAVSLVLPASARAQPLIILLFGDKLVSPNFQSGLNVSFVGTGLYGISQDMRLSWAIGAYGEFRLSERWSIQPEIMMKSPGGARNLDTSVPGYPFQPSGDPALDHLVTEGDVTRAFRSLSFPVTAKAYFGRVGLSAGMQFSVLLGSTDTVKLEDGKRGDKRKLSLEDSSLDAMRRGDVGATAGIEWAFGRGDHLRAFRMRARGMVGFLDTIKDNPRDPIRNWAFYLGVDIPIGTPKAPEPPPAPAASATELRTSTVEA